MDIKNYREHVRMLASRRSGEPIYNGSVDHATVVIEELFANARQNVRLLSGELNARIYGNSRVVQRAKEFLGHSDHRLEIFVERKTFSHSHPLIEEIGQEPNVIIQHIAPEISDLITYHFMTADNDCFRFEEDKESNVAVAAFGDTVTAGHLNTIFASIGQHTSPIDKELVSG